MILDLLLDYENSLLYESTALEEVETFLLNSSKILTNEQLEELKEFIRKAPTPSFSKKKDRKGITSNRKKHFLALMANKTKPIGQEQFKIQSGWVGPMMAQEEFSALSDDQIVQALTKSNKDNYSDIFKDIFQDWEAFVPLHPRRAWNIIQMGELASNKKLWEKTAQALAYTRNQSLEKEIYKEQWIIFAQKDGFLDSYIQKELHPEPIIDWLNRTASQIGLSDEIYLYYWFILWENSKDLPIFTSTVSSGQDKYQQEYLSTAINDSRGKLAEGILDALYRHKPDSNSLIPLPLLKTFNLIFDTNTEQGWLAQLIFARHFRNLVIIDTQWTKSQLLPALDFEKNLQRASRLWVGFLYNPNLNFESFEIIKPLLLGVLSIWDKMLPNNLYRLNDLRRNLIHLVTFYKINFPESVTDEEFKTFFKELNTKDLSKLFYLFEDLLQDPIDSEQELSFWEKSLLPFFNNFWPAQKGSPRISLRFLEMAAQCPNAIVTIAEYLKTKPFLTKGDFTHNRLIYSISQKDDSKFSGVLKTLENAKAFFDLFWKTTEELSKDETSHWGFYGIKEFFEIFALKYPTLLTYDSFKKARHKFHNT